MPWNRGGNQKSNGAGNCLAKQKQKHVKARPAKKGAPGNIDEFEMQIQLAEAAKETRDMHSKIDETAMEEFMAKANLAGRTFAADRAASSRLIHTVGADGGPTVVLATKRQEGTKELHDKYNSQLRIPRRPQCDISRITAEELKEAENQAFLEWRRNLAELEEEAAVILTPFERNIEVWRQLWRVLERSHVVVQIVDARNPLLYRSTDLEDYVESLPGAKINVLLINKADLISEAQRQLWADYFKEQGILAYFWSATIEDNEEEAKKNAEKEREEKREAAIQNVKGHSESDEENSDTESEEGESDTVEEDSESEESDSQEEDQEENDQTSENSLTRLHNTESLTVLLASFAAQVNKRPVVIGMVGYPNVGKSSTINRLIGTKKVAVSATPGRTRHFQTLPLNQHVTLCDCPGLVLPSLAVSRAHMLLAGVLPVDQMRAYEAAVQLIIESTTTDMLQMEFGIGLPPREKGEKTSVYELLTCFAFTRGFMTTKGIPDTSRAARDLVRAVVVGRLCLAKSPPEIEQTDFDKLRIIHKDVRRLAENYGQSQLAQIEKRKLLATSSNTKAQNTAFDRDFFGDAQGKVIVVGRKAVGSSKKHNNFKKHEKSRRLYQDKDN